VPPPHFWSKQQWASFFREFGENPCRHQKVLVSNLSLAVFVKHLVKLIKQVLQPALRGWGRGVRGELKGRDLMVFSIFAPYCSKSLQMFSLFS
jgi:hypothetical protein